MGATTDSIFFFSNLPLSHLFLVHRYAQANLLRISVLQSLRHIRNTTEPPGAMFNDQLIDPGATASNHGDIELKTTDETTVVRSATKPHGIRVANDDVTLRRLGKRPLLIRSFGFMSILGLSCSALSSWEAILNTSVPALLEGGPGAVVWSFIIGWIGTISVTATLGEMSSMAPTAGGQCTVKLEIEYNYLADFVVLQIIGLPCSVLSDTSAS